MPTNTPGYWSKNGGANYKKYQGTKKAKTQRATRNTARKRAEKAGLVKKGDGKDVDHKTPLSKGGSNKKSNTRVISSTKNRKLGAKIANKNKGKGYKKAPTKKKKVAKKAKK